MESARGMEILNGDLHIGFVHGRIHTYHVGQQDLERIVAAAHIQQPLIGQDFACYNIVAAISIGIQTRLPVVAEVIIQIILIMKHDVTFYVKWVSACVILIAMIFHVQGITPWNSFLQLIGAAGWVYVGYRWNERAIILNFLPQFAIIIPGLIYLYATR